MRGWTTSHKPWVLLGVVFVVLLVLAQTLLPAANSNAPTAQSTAAAATPAATATPARDQLTAPPMSLIEGSKYAITVQTPKGSIGAQLLPTEAPQSVNSLVYLARSRYYAQSTVYKVEPGKWVAMGGLNDDGTGGPGYTVAPDKSDRKLTIGSVAMLLQNGQVSSHFLIALDDVDPGQPYVVVGRVTDGLDVVRSLAVGDKLSNVAIQESR